MVFSSMDLVIDYDQSELISPYIKELCTNAQSAIYSRDSDIAKTAQSEFLSNCVCGCIKGNSSVM